MIRIVVLILGIALLGVAPPGVGALQFPEIAGWKLSAEVQTFRPEILFEYINGAADLYLACDFEELVVAEYARAPKASVTVEVYRHRTTRDAFGIYSQERLADGTLLDIGAQGYLGPHIINFLSGRYYVKIAGFDTGADEREILEQFAKKVAERLGEGGGLPPALTLFPPDGKKVNSEKYFTRNFLGYPFFTSVYSADYDRAGKMFKLFLIEAVDKNVCRDVVQQYLKQVKSPEQEVREGRYTLADPHHGPVDLFWKGRYIWGVVDLPDADLRLHYLNGFEARMQDRR